MDLNDIDSAVTLLCGVALIVGVVGVVVPVLPGLILCWVGVAVWAIFSDGGWTKWLIGIVATIIALVGTLVKYLWPGRNLKSAGVPNRSLIFGGLLGIAGFFLIPVVGLFIGFILGVYLSESVRLGSSGQAWNSTKHALKATGLSMLIELTAALAIAVVWVLGLVVA